MAPDTSGVPTPDPILDPTLDRGFFGHPKGLRTLFFTEMWERFSYYGMRALLTLFMVAPIAAGGLGFPASKAGPIYALYTSLVYLMSVPGGWLADNFLGQRRSVFYGGIVIMFGHISLALHGLMFFYLGLGLVIIGTGLLKPNISAIVGQLYAPQDARRDAGFSIFYMGINVGAFSAPLICGYLAQHDHFKELLVGWGMDPAHSWHWGFAAAAVGMFFGLMQYILTGKNMGEAGLRPAPPKDDADQAGRRRTLTIGVIAVGVLVAAALVVDSTAKKITSATWTVVPGHEYIMGGLTGERVTKEFKVALVEPGEPGESGEEADPESALPVLELAGVSRFELASLATPLNLSGKQEKDTVELDVAEVYQFEAEEPVDAKTIRVSLGEEVLAAIESAVDSGQTSGELTDLEIEVGMGLIGDKKILRTIKWEASRADSFAIAGTTDDGEALTYAEVEEPLTGDDLEGEIGEDRQAAVLAAVEGGATTGNLTGVSLKSGGLTAGRIKDSYIVLMLVIIIGLFSKLLLGGDWTPNERARLVTIFVLFCGAAVFWGVFEQAGSTLTLFADRSTQNSVFGWAFPSSWWQSVNALLIVALAPFFAWLWVRLGGRNPSDPAKFAVGLLFAGLGFFVLVGGSLGAGGWQRVSPMWLFSVYLLHTIGELWLSPVGLSSMTKLAPARVVGLMMGVWFLAASVGNFISGQAAGFYEDLALPSLFGYIALGAGVMSFVMFLLVGPIKRMLARSAG